MARALFHRLAARGTALSVDTAEDLLLPDREGQNNMQFELTSEELRSETGDILPRREALGLLFGDVNTVVSVNTGLAMNVLTANSQAAVGLAQQSGIH